MCTSLSNKQEKLVQLAIHTALSAADVDTLSTSFHGCVVALNSKPMSMGDNHVRGYINGQTIASCHAEISALYKYIRQHCRQSTRKKSSNPNLSRLDLWVVRVLKNGELRDSKPCWSCIQTIQQYGIRRVWYSTVHGDVISQSVQELMENTPYITPQCRTLGVFQPIRLI